MHSSPLDAADARSAKFGAGRQVAPAAQIGVVRTYAKPPAVVDGAVPDGFGGDGWIWISNDFAEVYSTIFLMRGWHEALLPLPAERAVRDLPWNCSSTSPFQRAAQQTDRSSRRRQTC
jgi:hypothetical protein